MTSKLLLFAIFAFSSIGFAARRDNGEFSRESERECQDYMADREFDRQPAGERGLVTNRVPLSVKNLVAAFLRGHYAIGLDSGDVEWLNPPKRGLLFLDEINLDLSSSESNISRKDRLFLQEALKPGSGYHVTFDKAFEDVVRQCQAMVRYEMRNGQRVRSSRWIQDSFIENFTKFHKAGYAHSVEVWYHDRLVAGLYGVFMNGVFSGESMFRLTDADGRSTQESSDAAKLALFKLIERLKNNGHAFIDTQMVLGLLKKWGAVEVDRQEYMMFVQYAKSLNRPY